MKPEQTHKYFGIANKYILIVIVGLMFAGLAIGQYSSVTADYFFGDGSNLTNLNAGYTYIVYNDTATGIVYAIPGGKSGTSFSGNATQALRYALNSSGIIHVRPGTYNVTNLTINFSNTILEGEGWGTIIRQQDNVTLNASGAPSPDIISPALGVGNILIRDLMVDGNARTNNATTRTVASNGVGIETVLNNAGAITGNITIDNVWVNDTIRTGIVVRNNVFVRNSKITNSKNDHPIYYSVSHNASVKDSVIGGIYDTELVTFGTSSGSGAYDVVFEGNTVNGIVVNDHPQTTLLSIRDGSENVTIKNNKIFIDALPALLQSAIADGGNSTKIINNEIYGKVNDGDSSGLIITNGGLVLGNYLYGLNSGTYSGIRIAANTNDLVVSNNMLRNIGYNGIRFFSSSAASFWRNVSVNNNYIESGSHQVRIYGAAFTLGNNVTIYNNFFKPITSETGIFVATATDNSVKTNNYGSAPYYWGVYSAAPSAFGAGDTYYDSDLTNLCVASAAGTGNWLEVKDMITACS